MTHLETLQSVFTNRAFVVPDYQRGYAWETEQRRDLLTDLADLAKIKNGKTHFTGTLVLHRGRHTPRHISGLTYEIAEIVDGQQRLTTLVILLSCVAGTLAAITENDDCGETARELRRNYVAIQKTSESLPRLTLSADTDLFFRDHVLGSVPAAEVGIPAHTNLLTARREFDDYLAEQTKGLSDADKGAFLMEFAHRITGRLGFVVYEVTDEAEVGVMFEVMNARGRPLTDMEKVKNYLLYLGSRVSDTPDALAALSQNVNATWRMTLEKITEAGQAGNEDQFLRYHYRIYPGATHFDDSRAKTTDIHGAVKKTFQATDDAAGYLRIGVYLQSLRSVAVSYRDVLYPLHDKSFPGLSPAKRETLVLLARCLRRIGRGATLTPVLIAAHSQFAGDAPGLTAVFRSAEVMAFRLAATGRRANAGDAYAYNLAAEIMNGSVSATDAASKLNGLSLYYCSDNQLRAALTDPEKDYYNDWSPLRYFLFEYERHLVETVGNAFVLDWNSFYKRNIRDSVEHILPQGENTLAITYWGDRFTPEQWAKNRGQLGNLCLTNWNGSYSNHAFSQKRGSPGDATDAKVYAHSQWRMERELTTFADWTPTEIKTRGDKLVAFALSRWSV